MRANRFMLITVFSATILFFVLWQTAVAGPPEKPGNPGVPGLLAEIAELEDMLDQLQYFAPVPQTGQTVILEPGDDGHLEKGVAWPDPRFTDNEDGTVTDNLTGLIWTKDVNIYGATTWNEALTSCNSCNVGGYTDWYLPNVRELNSLIDYGGAQYQKLPAGHPFTGTMGPSWYYWSSTNHSNTPYTISFENGFMWGVGVTSLRKFWCVRSIN